MVGGVPIGVHFSFHNKTTDPKYCFRSAALLVEFMYAYVSRD